ncbi:MAG: sugar-binding protein [Gemmatimonadetes bacterium]|nr:sugar-binding protein [Gemmatimonadota bacterium]
MPRPKSAPEPYLLGKVSALYYLRHHTQQEIAERLRVSRPTVSRLLREARDLGYVQITVASPRGLHLDLETQLEDVFELQVVQVIESPPGQNAELLRRQLGAAAAHYLARTVRPGETIGMAWGTTLNAMVDAMVPVSAPGSRVVQILGGIGAPDAPEYGAVLVRRLARLLEAQAVLLPAPGVVATAEVRDALRKDPHVRAALNELDSLDTVFVGLGSLASNPVLNDGHTLSKQARKELRNGNAVGDIALRFFDAHGQPVDTTLDNRILGITTDQIRKVDRVVAVAGGKDKITAIAAALEAKIVDVLITDRATAEALVGKAS